MNIENIKPAQKEQIQNIDNKKTIQTADLLVDPQEQRLSQYRGKEFIGLPQRRLPKLDELLSGLRKFILLAAAPNIGKTALTIQIAIDLIRNNSNTCALFVSLEMTRDEVMDRLLCHLAQIPFKTLYFGSQKENDGKGWFTVDELRSLEEARKILKNIGSRFLIIDPECCPEIDANIILQHVIDLKTNTSCEHIVVVIDYLQVFPIPDKILKQAKSENELDRYRADQMINIKRALKSDPLIVITEARKGDDWIVRSIADILGSSRLGYSMDAGILLNPITNEELKEEIGKDGVIIREKLAQQGKTVLRLTIDKGRDGMQKGNILLIYYFLENRFEECLWSQIKNIINIESKVSSDSRSPAFCGRYSQLALEQ